MGAKAKHLYRVLLNNHGEIVESFSFAESEIKAHTIALHKLRKQLNERVLRMSLNSIVYKMPESAEKIAKEVRVDEQ